MVTPFYINLICPQAVTYNPCSVGSRGGAVLFKDIISGSFKLHWTKWLSQNLDWMVFGETLGVGRLLVVLHLVLTIKKDKSPFNFQLNEPFLIFLWQLLWHKAYVFSKKIIIHCAHIARYLPSAIALPMISKARNPEMTGLVEIKHLLHDIPLIFFLLYSLICRFMIYDQNTKNSINTNFVQSQHHSKCI